jgi:hypothetical protein
VGVERTKKINPLKKQLKFKNLSYWDNINPKRQSSFKTHFNISLLLSSVFNWPSSFFTQSLRFRRKTQKAETDDATKTISG